MEIIWIAEGFQIDMEAWFTHIVREPFLTKGVKVAERGNDVVRG